MPNPQLSKVPRDAMPVDIGAAFDASMQLRGDATFFSVFANHLDLYRWYIDRFYGEVFYGGSVDRRYKELARLRLSLTHGCRFCNQGNRKDALAAGLTEEDIAAVEGNGSEQLNPDEQAVIKLADQMVLTNPGGELTAKLHGELKGYFDDGQILELGLVLGILSGVAKFLFVFDLVEKEENCPFPHEV